MNELNPTWCSSLCSICTSFQQSFNCCTKRSFLESKCTVIVGPFQVYFKVIQILNLIKGMILDVLRCKKLKNTALTVYSKSKIINREVINNDKINVDRAISQYKSSRSQVFFEMAVLKDFAIFTGKPLYWSLRPAALLKKTL